MRIGQARKGPNDTLDYDIELEDWLKDGESVTQIEASADEGLTVDSVSVDNTAQVAKVWLSGGSAGQSYEVTVTLTTASRVKECCFTLRVVEC